MEEHVSCILLLNISGFSRLSSLQLFSFPLSDLVKFSSGSSLTRYLIHLLPLAARHSLERGGCFILSTSTTMPPNFSLTSSYQLGRLGSCRPFTQAQRRQPRSRARTEERTRACRSSFQAKEGCHRYQTQARSFRARQRGTSLNTQSCCGQETGP